MSSNLKKVQSGDPLVIPAAAFNAFIDAARDYRERRQNTGGESRPAFRRADIVLIRNDSGADRDRFDVLGIDGPLFTPTDNLDEFKNRMVLKGVVPASAHRGRFVILLEPVPAGEIGRAFAAGVCPARVYVTSETHAFADVDEGDPSRLRSVASGAATILWAESGTGEKWAVVKLGGLSAGGYAFSFCDDFNRNDGPIGPYWDEISGCSTPQIVSGALQVPDGGWTEEFLTDGGGTPLDVAGHYREAMTFYRTKPGAQDTYILIRVDPTCSDGIQLIMEWDDGTGTGPRGTSILRLQKAVGGVKTDYDTCDAGVLSGIGTAIHLELDVLCNHITGKLNGVPRVFTVTDDLDANTHVGFGWAHVAADMNVADNYALTNVPLV